MADYFEESNESIDTKSTEYSCSCTWCGGKGKVNIEDHTDLTNLKDVCPMCDGLGQYKCHGEPTLSNDFLNFFNLISHTVENTEALLDRTKEMLTDFDHEYCTLLITVYNEIIDRVMHYVINNEDAPLPFWYKENLKNTF